MVTSSYSQRRDQMAATQTRRYGGWKSADAESVGDETIAAGIRHPPPSFTEDFTVAHRNENFAVTFSFFTTN